MPNRPLPRNLRLTRPSENPLPTRESAVTPQLPAPPPWLSANARAHWNAVAAQMQSEGLWRPVFERTLATYVELLSLFFADPQEFGSTKLVTLRLLGADLGLTPSSFNRVARTR